MTVKAAVQQPLYIQSAKIIDWLLSRKLLPKDYPKRLERIREKFNATIALLDKNELNALNTLVPYYTCTNLLESAQSTDVNTGFFSRSSDKVRTWKDLVDEYRRNSVYIAEIGEKVNEVASVTIPRCRNIISDRQKQITHLHQKLKLHHFNVTKKEETVEKAFREFHVQPNELSIRLPLLKEATGVPVLLDAFVRDLKDISPALELYKSFRSYMLKDFGSNSTGSIIDLKSCPTLQLLIDSGHVHMFTWKYGHPPKQVEADDDFIPLLLSQEEACHKPENVQSVSSTDQPADVNDINWTDNEDAEIDFGEDVDIVIEVGEPGDTVTAVDSQIETAVDELKSESTASDIDCARGKSARRLLDTDEGCRALLNDLTELSAFLGRFYEDMVESQAGAPGFTDSVEVKRSTAAGGGSVTLQHVIMQGTPSTIQSISFKTVGELLSLVDRIREKLTTSTMSQLLLIRHKPGYLDRVVSRLEDVRVQVTRAKDRVADAQLMIDRAAVEQEEQSAALLQHRADGKRLVALLEEEITKLCSRPVNIVGQVLDM